MKSSPGRRPPAILPARSRRGRGCCSCSSERSAPEKRKKKIKIKRGKKPHTSFLRSRTGCKSTLLRSGGEEGRGKCVGVRGGGGGGEMPAELMERPRRGTGRTRSRAGRREKGIPHLRRPAAPVEGLPGIPAGTLGRPTRGWSGAGLTPSVPPAGTPSLRGCAARPCWRGRRAGGGELPFQCRLLTERH